jgi:hypothetical protein
LELQGHWNGFCKRDRLVTEWLEPLQRALNAARGGAEFFFRDDDAGWHDERLRALLGVFARHAVALDLAVIPAALNADLARELSARLRAAPALLGVHQHGYAHVDHEPARGKCEFGDARSRAEQQRDIAAGAEILRASFAEQVDPIFTPPWNRCNATTVDCLAELGYRVLSRERAAALPAARGLSELSVDIDWCRALVTERQPLERLGRALAAAAASGRPTGVMLHHGVMADEHLAQLGELLRLLSKHPASRCSLMRELAD